MPGFLTQTVYLSAWIALTCYALCVALLARERSAASSRWPRRLWTAGAVFYLLHVASAFGVFYEWSHTVAVEDVRRRSRDLTGLEAGWGLYLNYAFGVVWAFEAFRWLRLGDAPYRNRPAWQFVALHGFFLFLLINGAFVFVAGPSRWYGLFLFLLSLSCCVRILFPDRPDRAVTR